MRYLVPVFICSTALWAQATSGRAAAPRAPVSAATANPNDAAPPSVRPEDKCLLEGTVVNSITGEPLKMASGHFGLGHGSGAHAPDEYYVIESTNPNMQGFDGAALSFVQYLYELAK